MRAIIGITMLLGATFVAGTAAQQQDRVVGETRAIASESVNKIVDNPEHYYGERVRVRGPIGDVFSARVFNIEEQGIVDLDDELLVLWPHSIGHLSPDDTVEVTGTVRRMTIADIERDYGTYDWGVNDEFFTRHRQRPVLVAEAIDAR